MRVLMISIDKGLVGGKPLGDVIERHKKYGEFVDRLDIIVLSKKGYHLNKISEKVQAMPTNSSGKVFYLFGALKIAREWFRTIKYDLIVTQDPYLTGWTGALLKMMFGSKLLIHFHGDFSLNALTGFPVRRADAVRVMSEGQRNKLVKKGIHENKIIVISTPVDIERFTNFESQATDDQKRRLKSFREQFGDKKMILMVGRPDKIKGYDVLKQARDIVVEKKGKDNVGFWTVGSNEIWADVVSGNTESKDLPAYYYASFLTVLPSYSESFGKVLVEANACGKSVVATATTGAKEIVVDGYNGYLVPVGDYQRMAEKILYLLDHPDLAREMGERGRRLVREKFANNAEKVIQLWEKIVDKP